MKKKVVYKLVQEYTTYVTDEEAELMEMSMDELIEYRRESLEFYGDDRLDALVDSRNVTVSTQTIEECEDE